MQWTYVENRHWLADFEKLMVTKEDRLWQGDGLGIWDGNVLKSCCEDGCTTVNIIKFIEFKKKKNKNKCKKEKNYLI